jgi:hypothetical protein
VQGEEFQQWKLIVRADNTATLTCDDGNERTVFSKPIEFTDLPAEGVALYVCNRTILLPGEH